MPILVTTLCERVDKHDRSRRPMAAMWPHTRRRDTLQSANILQNKFTSLNLENIIVIYTIMTIKGKALCALSCPRWYLRPPCGPTPGAKAHYNQLTYYETSLHC